MIEQGKVMGDIAINWYCDPHLYFQIIRKLIGIFENYPGADSKNDIPFYRNNWPDPNLLLKLDLKVNIDKPMIFLSAIRKFYKMNNMLSQMGVGSEEAS